MVGRQKNWRVACAIIAIVYIAYLWIKKGIISDFSAIPKDEMLPMVITTILVLLFKVAVIAGFIMLLKWAYKKITNKE